MNHNTVRTIVVAGLALALLAGGVAFGPAWLATPSAQAQSALAPLPRTITVVGDGTVSITPDVARANIGVEVVRPSVEEASAENSQIVQTLLTTLKEQGIADADIQTTGFTVYAERYGDGDPVQTQYRVGNSVTVLIRDLESVGEVLDAAIKAGANNIYGVEYLLDEPTAARSEARKLAMDNAKATAEELAALGGVQMGKILSISEVIGATGGYYNNQFMQSAVGLGGGGGTPVEPGQLRLTMQLQVTYELVD
jgi:hypothetical protein